MRAQCRPRPHSMYWASAYRFSPLGAHVTEGFAALTRESARDAHSAVKVRVRDRHGGLPYWQTAASVQSRLQLAASPAVCQAGTTSPARLSICLTPNFATTRSWPVAAPLARRTESGTDLFPIRRNRTRCEVSNMVNRGLLSSDRGSKLSHRLGHGSTTVRLPVGIVIGRPKPSLTGWFRRRQGT